MLKLLGVSTLIEGTEPAGLPEYYLVGVGTVSGQFYFELPVPDHVSIIQVDPTLGGGMEANGPSECCSAE